MAPDTRLLERKALEAEVSRQSRASIGRQVPTSPLLVYGGIRMIRRMAGISKQ